MDCLASLGLDEPRLYAAGRVVEVFGCGDRGIGKKLLTAEGAELTRRAQRKAAKIAEEACQAEQNP
jgi:hypothetical protein